ncbi:CxxC motif-containing protein, DUF1111 family [Allopseudospirillum japonicum]|uniref:CxxC motif-containing protein, DUF1111 family n=1 Tax=Allopseudospirillum japonicum TaxID=64971 RepID=A0A1H6U3V3_9GAMM|nr:di-heme oxidoredictase family protein [Allopseudospirillum japonicum]SEI87038.1 CxxC motif-containing protein, DUF1111 family [Allopseudospirillum japonicum]
MPQHMMLFNRKIIYPLLGALSATCLLIASAHADQRPLAEFDPSEVRAGGEATVFKTDRNAFSLPSANMSLMRKLDFNVGNSFFRNPWVIAPASTDARDGLGPLYNTNACQNCHIKDGRGHPPEAGDTSAVSMFLRLSIPASTPEQEAQRLQGTEGVIPDPIYGTQLQDFAVPGFQPEGRMQIEYTYFTETLADGTQVELRKPHYQIADPAYGAPAENIQLSPRVAPPMIGLGLLEMIPAEAIVAQADPEDANQDGISGKANWVWDIQTQAHELGRFGWKAGMPTVMQQNSGAFAGDMGLTTHLHPHTDCMPTQACERAPNGISPESTTGVEVEPHISQAVEFYARNLAVPARRHAEDPQVLRGKLLFNELGCASCHTPHWQTAASEQHPEQSAQNIWPYTDLLLHDMGDGLADGRAEFHANGREWRTAPLWGIGLTEVVNGHTYFLHDGRARNLTEAILWHGGEAASAQAGFKALDAQDRAAILAFLNSL